MTAEQKLPNVLTKEGVLSFTRRCGLGLTEVTEDAENHDTAEFDTHYDAIEQVEQSALLPERNPDQALILEKESPIPALPPLLTPPPTPL